MKLILLRSAVLALSISVVACATTEKGSERASQQLMMDDQRDIQKADANYKDAVLKHGESSEQAVKAKAKFDATKNKYVADQQHVQQLRRIEAQPDPVEATTNPTVTQPNTTGASGSSQ